MDTYMKTFNDSVPHFNYSYTFWFENEFDNQATVNWFKDNSNLSFYLVALYATVVYLLKTYMEDKPSFQLKYLAFLWNISLSVFSLIVFLRMLPDLWFDLREYGFKYTLCDSTYILHNRVFGFWMKIFCYSKFVEFGDTFVIIFRKHPLTFLHVYHHITVSLGVFYFMTTDVGFGRWLPLINCFIHFVMYLYFGLKVMRVQIPKQISMLITAMQTCQMFTYMSMLLIVNYWNSSHRNYCRIPTETNYIIFILSFTYAILFLHFYYQAYLKKTISRKTIQKKE